MKGIMIRDREWEDNPYFLTRSEFDETWKKRNILGRY